MIKFSNISQSFKNSKGRFNVDLMFILAVYDAYLRHRSLQAVADVIGVTKTHLRKLIQKHIELQQAIDYADENRNKGVLGHHCVDRLSPANRKVWDKMMTMTTQQELDELFNKHPTQTRQRLLCTAILYTGYDVSKACQMVGIHRRMMEHWKNDLEFGQMMEELQLIKEDFFEHAVIGLVAEKHPGAIMYVNRTINAKRGYNEKMDISLGATTIQFDIEGLNLPLDVQKQILAAVEARKAEQEEAWDAENGKVGELKRLPAPKR